jgi:16S rRNA pseudouridine516 synthase
MGAGKHSKLLLSSGGHNFQAVYFGMPASSLEFYPGEKIDVLCQINVNEFRGVSSVQLLIQDVRLSEICEGEYDSEEIRYREILDGAEFTGDENVLPTRADIAEIYKFFRRENMSGHTSFTYRMLRSQLFEYSNMAVNYAKLRFAISILGDIRVCGVAEESDKTVMKLLPAEYSKMECFPCGRLDIDTVGLLLITNDGPLAHELLSPRHHAKKTYFYRCSAPVGEKEAERLCAGVDIGGYVTKTSEVELLDENSGYITLTEGKFHQIKRMFEAVGSSITYLRRVTFGGIPLDESLSEGEWRELSDEEISILRENQKS